MSRAGVLVMAYGTPASPEEIEPYYTRIRHGHAPTQEQLDDLTRRYAAIGGISPLAARTAAQVAGIAEALERRAPGEFEVAFGAKYADPFVEDGARTLAATCETVVGIVLTPHSASLGAAEYHARAAAVLAETNTAYLPIDSWFEVPGFAELQASFLVQAMGSIGLDAADPAGIVLFTAHSLPEKIIAAGDPYPDQVADSGRQIAAIAGVNRFEVAWQSAGRTRDPWIGPDVTAVLAGFPARGIERVVVCPVGFVADHLEVLYDLDVEAAQIAATHDVTFTRTASLNDHPAFMEVLAEAVLRRRADR